MVNFLGAALSWLFTFLSIIALMKPPYRGSFFSTETCKNHNIKLFSSPEESRKKEIFEVNELLWKKEIGMQVQAWVESRWEIWQNDRPQWLDENILRKIPLEYIPDLNHRNERRNINLRKNLTQVADSNAANESKRHGNSRRRRSQIGSALEQFATASPGSYKLRHKNQPQN